MSLQPTLFQLESYSHPKLYLFEQTELGKIHATIPWEALSACLPEDKIDRRGAPRWFSNQGMFGLMFLKHLLHTSDEKLIEPSLV